MNKEYTDEERFQLDIPPDPPEPDPSNDPSWQQLAQAYIIEHGKKIKALEERVSNLEVEK